MKIGTKLFLAVFVPVLLVLVVGATLIFSYATMEAAFDNGDKVRQIRDSITELNHLVISYITYREERPKEQFQAEQEKMTRLIAGARFRNPDQQKLLNEIGINSQSMKDAFFKLVSNTGFSGAAESNKLIKEVDERLVGQLLIRSHNADSIASALKSLVDKDIRKTQTGILTFIFVVLVLTTFPLGFILIRMRRSIVSDLTKLRNGIEVIRSGNLDYAITVGRNDEIGDLTQAFNRMTLNLKEVTASKADLEREMVERHKAETELRASRKFLEIANRHTDLNPLLKDFVGEMKEFTGCEAVGIRLREENGNIPYMAYLGFGRKFYETESPLSLKTDHCLCINVIKGTTDPGLSFYTEGGSFYMNGTTRFLATVSEEDKGQTRNVCNQTGYESVALIPIRLGPNILGLIHLADRNENRVPLNTVKVSEQVASALGIGIQRTMAEEELRRQREWLRVTLTSIGDAVMTTDASGRITFLNPVAQALTGWRPEETTGQPVENIFRIINERNREPAEDIVRRVLRDGSVVTLSNHTALITREGKLIPIEDSAAPIKDDAGNITGMVLVFHDVTEKRRAQEALRESENRLRRFYESGLLGVFYWNMNGEITEANDKFLEMVGFDREDLTVGRIEWSGLTPPEYRPLDENSVAELKTTGMNKTPFEKEYIRKDGSRLPILIAGAMLDEVRFNGVAFVLDITERKRAEGVLEQRTLELEHLTETLEERVKERTAELADLSSRLVSAQEDERRRVSYDLHDNAWQALVAIRLEMEDLFSDREGMDRAALQKRSKKIMADLLEAVGKIRSMQGDLWPYVLDDIGILATVDWYCREFEKSHPGLTIKRQESLAEHEIPSSAKLVIYRILQETLSNVAKHSQARRVTLRLQKNDHRMEFTVEDNGLGFDPEEVMVKRSPWGGLGLLNLKARTELSGGLLEVESVTGQGTMVRAFWSLQEND